MAIHLIWLLLTFLSFFSQVNSQSCKTDGCPDGLCCSEHGYCGDTPEHCEGSTPKPPPNNNITLKTGDCRICGCSTPNDCCSHYGFCGNTPEHCEKLTVILPESTLISQTRIGDCRICQNCQKTQLCCPNTGYCVDKEEQCDETIPINTKACQVDPIKVYKIFNNQNKKFLDSKYFSTNSNSSTITQWSESNTFNQYWQFIPVNPTRNIYLIVSIATTKALTITSSKFLQQWSYNTENLNQQFQLQEENHLCKIVNLQTNQTIVVKDKSNGAPAEIDNQQSNLWELIEANTSAKNRYWNVFIDEKLGEICDDNEKQTSENKLTLQNCLNWCNIDQRKKFCMWNFFDEDDQIGYCISANQCDKRTIIENEKYRIYIHQPNTDISSSDEILTTPTASLTNYIDYSKYLLLEANDFVFPIEPLHCTDLDPQKEAVLTFESSDDGIRLCDLCPNLSPFDKYPDYLIHSIPMTKTANIKFDECFLICVENVRCIGYSYNQQNFTCLTFNQTSIIGTDGLIYQQQWITILIKQPIGIIQNWLYTRHTKIAIMQIDEENIQTEQTETFLQCLNICSHSQTTCIAITYDFSTKICQLFENITTNNWIQLSYGSISAFHFSHIYGNESSEWKFILQDDNKNINIEENPSLTDISKTCTLPNETLSSEYRIYYNPNCLIGGGNGCDLQNGCQLCLKFKANFEQNLPLCPSSFSNNQQLEQANIQIENCMKNCIQQSTNCIGFDYDPITSLCTYIKTYSNWSINQKKDSKRYLLSYPPKSYQFIPDCQLISSSTIESKTLDECLKTCQPPCEKISYNYNTLKCQIGSYSTGILRIESQINSHCFIRNFNKNNDLTSIRMAFYRNIGYEINLESLKEFSFQCKHDCSIELDECLTRCLDSSECQYVSVTYETTDLFSCRLFNNRINETKDFIINDLSEIYYRYFDINLNQNTIDNRTLFQVESDLAECYDQTRIWNKYDQTYSTLKGYKDVLDSVAESDQNNLIKLRRRRFLKKVLKWIGDKIVKPVVNAVVDIVKTPIQVGKAIGAAISGDTEKAKNEILDIGIVKDAISLGENVIEFGKALGEGDLEGAGKSLLNVGADALGFVPIPGGRVLGKIGSAGIKNGLKNTKSTVKPKAKDQNKKDNKKSDDEKKKQCSKRTKRNVNRDDCDSDDDDNKSNPKCRKPSIRNTLKVDDCHMKSIGTKCEWECDIGYIESDENGVICKKENNKNAFWRPKPECKAQSCGTGNYPLISVETDKIVAYTIYFDKKRRLPIWSFSIHDTKNRVTPLTKVKRARNFLQHPCPTLKNDQGNKARYTSSGWDRGHLSPSDAHRYSDKASKSSNLFINVAPQDPWTNQIAWKIVEAHVLCHNNKYPASLVATGICPNSIGKTKAINGLDVPSCFWKMICYMRNGQTHVVGFLAENTKISRSDKTLTSATKLKIFKPVSQATIRDQLRSDSEYLKNPFDLSVYAKSDKGRTPTLVQPAMCANAMSLDQTEANAWYNDFTAIKKNTKNFKRQLPGSDARGCSPGEAQVMALIMGLPSLDIDDDENDNAMENEDENDLGDDADDDDDGGNDGHPEAAQCGKRIVGYYPSWGTGKISKKHIQRLTHIIYAFFEVDSSGQVLLGSADRTHSKDIQKDIDIAKKRLEHLLKLKKSYREQKYLFAIGGWENSQYFSSIAQSPEKRLKFIASSLKLIDEYDFDGIDIDWEYPVTGGAVEGTPEDKQNYVVFMKEIRQALDQHGGSERKYLLSFASAAGQWTLDPGYDLPELLKYADFVNIMTYDFFGAWESKWGAYTGPPAPLYFGMPERFSGKTNVDWTVKYYVCKTNEPHKINMGVPFYGRYWKNVAREPIDPADGMWRKANAVNGKFEGGFVPWNEIKTSWLTNPVYKQQNHDKSKSSYAYNEQEGIYLGFESPESLKDKVKYATEKNIGGLMIWAIDQDDDDLTMMNIVSSAPLCQNTDPKATFYKCSPLKGEKRWWTLEDSEEKAGMCGRSAALYKGYYPLCDPDDPGYSCCSPEGYCGFSDKHCKGQGINYGENPDLLIEEPIRPTINPILWYLLDAPDGKRGRCGRDVPKLDNGEYAICNPDDKNGHCCSNGGYCGTGKEFCDCEECIDFKKQPNYRFKPKRWHDDGKCGEKAPPIDNQMAICNPDSKTAYCCSSSGYCGEGAEFCDCEGCINYKN